MLGSIIKISKLIFAMFALRICAKHLKLSSKNASKNQPVVKCGHINGGFMKSKEIKELFNKFEQIACEYEGVECWSARELAVLLGYGK